MSKKKNKYFTSGKKSKKMKKSMYKEPELKRVKSTMDKDDAKQQKKILLAPVDIDKRFMKNRRKCNHAGKLISVEEFKGMTPLYGAYTPMLDTAVEMFGEENVKVCKDCYDVLVNGDCISSEDLQHALATIYLSCNRVVSSRRMKPDEVKELNGLKDQLNTLGPVLTAMRKLDEAEDSKETAQSGPTIYSSNLGTTVM